MNTITYLLFQLKYNVPRNLANSKRCFSFLLFVHMKYVDEDTVYALYTYEVIYHLMVSLLSSIGLTDYFVL